MGDTRERILEVAGEVFGDEGYHQATMRKVARLAGVQNPTIYHYFGSKEGLYCAVLEQAVALHDTRVTEAVSTVEGGREKLLAFIEITVSMGRDRPRFAQLAVEAALTQPVDFPDVRRLFETKKAAVYSTISGWLDEALGGRLPAARLDFLTTAFICLVFGLVQQVILEPETFDPRPESIRWLVNALLDGLEDRA